MRALRASGAEGVAGPTDIHLTSCRDDPATPSRRMRSILQRNEVPHHSVSLGETALPFRESRCHLGIVNACESQNREMPHRWFAGEVAAAGGRRGFAPTNLAYRTFVCSITPLPACGPYSPRKRGETLTPTRLVHHTSVASPRRATELMRHNRDVELQETSAKQGLTE